jgi:hypothetical protein
MARGILGPFGGVTMAFNVRRVDYFYATVTDQPGEAHTLLSQLADLQVNLLALNSLPVGPLRTQFTLFPDDSRVMVDAAGKAGLGLDGPHPALLVQGDDQLGALAEVHEKLAAAGVNVYASNGVTNGSGSYGYVVYVRPEEYERATSALGI